MKRLGLVLLLAACEATRATEEALSVSVILGGGGGAGAAAVKGYERALEPRRFSFPADHGPHPGFRSEWWYLTGHLAAGDRRFGYQLTIFRQGLAPSAPARASAWGTRQVYMGHLALTDVAGGRLLASERLAREALGLAGATTEPFAVWVESWRIDGRGLFPLALSARTDEVEIELAVDAGRGPILQGEGGLSKKGSEPGNASYYYAMTRMPTRGRIRVGDHWLQVRGTSWLDREWSTSALSAGVAGWDWLALNLSDGRDLMVYRLRRTDGSATPESRATLVLPDATTQVFGPDGFSYTPLASWNGYATSVRLTIPSEELTIDVKPLVADQELRLSVRYWEGAVEAAGKARHVPLTATGYLELTGVNHAHTSAGK